MCVIEDPAFQLVTRSLGGFLFLLAKLTLAS